jgi:acyl-CoA synthetase (AMP-forming)/AMP-acid ligase II
MASAPLTIPAVLAATVAARPDAEAVVAGDVRWTWAELDERVTATARALVASGVAPGDRVAVWAPNSPEWIVLSLATHRAGAVLVPLNTRFKGIEAAEVLGRSGARLLFTVDEFLGIDFRGLLADAGGVPAGTEVVDLAALAAFASSGAPGSGGSTAAVRLPEVGPDDVSHLQFTAGTTGRPKGAMLRHRAMAQTTRVWADTVGLRPDDRYLIASPFFHIMGHKTGVLACVTVGATILPVPVFSPEDTLALVERERVTVLPGPPTLYHSLLEHPARDAHDLSSLRLAVTGAASVPVELVKRVRSELPFDVVITAYGLTEATGVVTMCRPDDPPEVIAETAGVPIAGVELRLAEGTDEVLVRGVGVMAGYLDDPVASAEAIDPDGWLHTGDVGRLSETGHLTITDRLKDLYICGGFNVYPAEVEDLLLRHPGVGQAAVIGVPDERLGEVGHAFVVRRGSSSEAASLTAESLVAWSREHMANFKVPRGVTFVDALPMNAAGKVTKPDLRARLSARG